MASRGLGDSKFEAFTLAQGIQANESAQADTRATAIDNAYNRKTGFLTLLQGGGSELLQSTNQSTAAASNSLVAGARIHNSYAETLTQQNAAMVRELSGALIGKAGAPSKPGGT